MLDSIIVVLFSYTLGSIPFGLILTKLFSNEDIRKIGSGNIGATNVLRTGNKFLAVLTLVFDVAKGYIAVIIATIKPITAAPIKVPVFVPTNHNIKSLKSSLLSLMTYFKPLFIVTSAIIKPVKKL